MSERPILFNAEMVRAILDWRKTQTRRVVKSMRHPYGYILRPENVAAEVRARTGAIRCPYGQPGGLLWVREAIDGRFDCDAFYMADGERLVEFLSYNTATIPELPCRVISPMHMPKWAARLWLRITDVRVERLQDITPEDAMAEGMGFLYGYGRNKNTPRDARRRFAEFWDEINTNRGYPWESNPWVWVIEFERMEAKDE